jgi:hypothetical protein
MPGLATASGLADTLMTGHPVRLAAASMHATHYLEVSLCIALKYLPPVSGNRGHEGCSLVRQVAAERLPSEPCQPTYLVAHKMLGYPLSTPSE